MSIPAAPSDTRDRFLQAAFALFAEKGFYGASMDQIAREVALTKQALIHHFGTKEKLYGVVLSDISTRLLAQIEDEATFADAIVGLHRRAQRDPKDTQLLMRELLDNRSRAASAGTWYLRPFIDRLHSLLKVAPGWECAPAHLVATHTYQVLGAIHYFVVSVTTLEAMYSANQVKSMRRAFPERLRTLAELPPPAAG
ncbi:MAG: helix-turn-helix domain-containing protein [Pseudomonadota bacterium]